MLEVGINTNNECGKDAREILTNIKDAGFKNVMVAFKVGKAEEILKIATELGLNVPFVHLSASNNLWAKGKENEWFMATLKEQIELTAKYKIPAAVLHATHGRAEQLALPPSEFGLNCFSELVQFAKNLNVRLALENLDKPSIKHFKYVMENIKDKNLGFCYDAGHHQLYLPNVDLLKKYGDRIIAIHMHDNLMDWEEGYDWTRDLHMLPFDGKIDYNKVIKKLAATNYKNVIMLEVHKNSGSDQIYDEMSNLEFLKEAKKRGEKLADMLENARSKKT